MPAIANDRASADTIDFVSKFLVKNFQIPTWYSCEDVLTLL